MNAIFKINYFFPAPHGIGEQEKFVMCHRQPTIEEAEIALGIAVDVGGVVCISRVKPKKLPLTRKPTIYKWSKKKL